MTIVMRDFHWEKDFELVRSFIIELYNLTYSLKNWLPIRFENRKFGPCGTEYCVEEDDLVKIWEDVNEAKGTSKMVAVTIAEGESSFVINTHPDYKAMESKIIKWVEEQVLLEKNDNNETEVCLFVLESDTERIALLEKEGYALASIDCYSRTRPNNLPLDDLPLATGYSIRHVIINNDFEKYREVQGAVFRHCGNMTKKQAIFYSTASFYKKELDLIAIAPDGTFAAFCTIRLDPIGRFAEFEPVGTHPEHRRKGLGKALIVEGLRRLLKYKPKLVCIPGAANTPGANKLYDSVGFTEKKELQIWKKKLK